MTKRIARLALALGAAAALAAPAVPASASSPIFCTDRPFEDCLNETIEQLTAEAIQVPCIPSGDLEDGCPQ